MSQTIIILFLVAVAAAAPQQKNEEPIPIVSLQNEGVNHDGSYQFAYETGNGIRAEESGYVTHLSGRSEEESKAQVVQGSYSYTGPDGVLYSVHYIADEKGFRAEGAHIPNPRPYDDSLKPTVEPPSVGFPLVRPG